MGTNDFERWFDALATAATVGVWRTQAGEGNVFVSERLVEIAQCEREQLLGFAWLDLVHPEDLDRMVEHNEHAMATGDDIDVEFRIIRGDGALRWVQSHAVTVRGDDGATLGYCGTIEDITEFVEAAEEAAHLAAACEATSDVVAITDAGGHFHYLNPAARELIGLPDHTPIGDLTTADLLTADSLEVLETEGLMALSRDGRWQADLVIRASGEEVPVSVVATVERDDDGELENVAIVARDLRPEYALVAEANHSDAQFRLLAEASPYGIVELDLDGNVVYSNGRWSELTGMSADETKRRMRSADFVHPDDRDQVVAEAARAFQEGREISVDHRVVRPDAESLWVRARTGVIRDENGTPTRFVGIIEDIGAERQARANVDRLVDMLERTVDLASIVDTDGNTLFLNRAARKLFGVERDDDLGKFHYSGRVAPEAIATIENEMVPALEEHGVWQGEYSVLDRTGTAIPISQTTVASTHGDGTVVYASIGRDITPLKEAESQLAQSEVWFRTLLQHLTDLVWVRSAEGRIVYVSPSIERVLGRSVPDVLAMQPQLDFVHPDDLDAVREGSAHVLAEPGAHAAFECRIRHRDGNWVWLDMQMHNLLEHPAINGVVVSATDVTASRRARDARVRSEAILRAVVQQSPIAIYALDDQGRAVLWNRAAEELFRVSEDEVLGRSLPFVEPGEEDAVNQLLARVFGGETIRGLETTRRRPDGTAVEVNLSAAPVCDADGNVVMAIGVIADITDRRQAEEMRRQGEERFRALVTHASDMVVVYGVDGRVQYASPSAGRWGGYDPDEIVGQPLDRAHPDDRGMVMETMREVIANGGTSAPITTRVQHADGSWRWVEIVLTNLIDDATVGGIVTNARDVTERVEASEQLLESYEALRLSNEALRAVFQNAPLAIYAFDAEGVIQFWNPACEDMFGFHADEAIGRYSPVVREEDAHAASELRTRVMAGESVEPVATRRLHKDGREIDVMFAAAPMRDETGRVVACLAMSSDISSQKEHERALRENEARFRALAEHASVIIMILEADGTLRYTSPSAQSILGYPEGSAQGVSAFDFVHPDEVEQVVDLYQEAMAHPGIGQSVKFRTRHADGSYRLVEAVGNNLLDDPAVCGVVITVRDMTEQFEAEEALRRSEERFRAIVQNLSDIVSIVDADGTLGWTSPAVERVLGYSATDGPPFNPIDVVHPEDRPYVEQAVAALEKGSRLEPISFRVRHADGSWRSVESVFDDLRDDPSVGGLVVTSRDVTEKREAEAQLAESESRYRGIVEDQTELICRFRRDGTLTFVNGAYARYFGKQVDELMGTNFAPFIPDDDRPRVARSLAALGPENPVMTVEHRVVAPDGSLRWQQWTNRVVLDDRGNTVEYQAVGRDVTQQREAEGLVSDQARILETIARGAPLPETLAELCRVVETHAPDVTCSVLLVNDDGATLRHGAAPSLPDTFVRALDSIPIGPRSISSGTAAYLGESVVVTDIETDPLWAKHRSVALSHGLRACWATPIRAASGEGVIGAFALYWHDRRSPSRAHERLVDMVGHLATIAIDRKYFETKLAHQAHHDPLTGLPNRVLFLEFLVLALARARRYRSQVAVLFMDLDRFKVVNDSLGHDAGDELLVSLGERLRGVLRPGDTVARFGGDEFVILCEDLSGPQVKQQAVEVAERLLDVIKQPFRLDGDEHFLSASIGIALAISGDDRPEVLLRDADAAMYRAKDRGKGRWELFDETMRATAMARLETENALHRAIDRGEFRVFYQPVMSVADGSCTGVEALVRWQHPERGLVAPHEFIQLAEETGLVVPLGGWVLAEACRQAARWHSQRFDPAPFQVAVNLSARQLAHPDLVDSVARALEQTGSDPEWLCLEITESVLMDDVDTTIGAIKRLKALGVDLSIDDFGTGYSSLGYLKRFPVDLVKVDRSFVDGLGSDPEDSAIVAAVVSLGHALGLRVVAEGVETEQQLRELVGLECDLAQGYYLAPPQPPGDIEDLVLGPRRSSGFERLHRAP